MARNLVEKRIQYYDPRMLERKAKQKVPDERLKESIDIITFKAGFTTVYVHGTSPDEVAFVRSFGEKILPYFTSQYRTTLLLVPTPYFQAAQGKVVAVHR